MVSSPCSAVHTSKFRFLAYFSEVFPWQSSCLNTSKPALTMDFERLRRLVKEINKLLRKLARVEIIRLVKGILKLYLKCSWHFQSVPSRLGLTRRCTEFRVVPTGRSTLLKFEVFWFHLPIADICWPVLYDALGCFQSSKPLSLQCPASQYRLLWNNLTKQISHSSEMSILP